MDSADDRFLKFLTVLFEQMVERNIRFAILHNGDNLKQALKSDIDIALGENPTRRVTALIQSTCQSFGFRVIHILHYEIPHGYYYIIVSLDDPSVFLHIDCLYDPIGVNRYYLTTPFLIEGSTSPNGFPQVCEEKAALYLLIKRCFKPGLDDSRYRTLSNGLARHIDKIEGHLHRMFGPRSSGSARQVAATTSSGAAEAALARLARDIRRSFLARHPVQAVTRLALDSRRKMARLARPSGFFLVLVGPDGCGKSTISDLLLTMMARGYRHTWRFHWRPGLLPRPGAAEARRAASDSSSPAEVSRYTGAISLMRFLYYTLDFIAGYWLRIYPRKARTSFIVGERYYPDVIVHPARYGFSTPRWFMRLFARFVPKPDLVVLLSNDPLEIHRRKAELEPGTIARQLAAYESEIPHWGRSVVVDTSAGPTEVAAEITRKVIDVQTNRLDRPSGKTHA